MFIDKVVRNVYSIGGGITVSAFGISLASSRVSAPKFDYPTATQRVFSGEIKTLEDIEDLEYTKGCKFYFYDPRKGVFDKVGIKPAREFPIEEVKKGEIVGEVNKWLKKEGNECTKGRYVYFRDVGAKGSVQTQ